MDQKQPEQAVEGAQEAQGDEKKLSKQQLKKLEKEKQKAEKKQQNQQKQKEQEEKEQEQDYSAGSYGDYELCQSQERTERVWTHVINIEENLVGKEVLVRARIYNSRVKGNLAFFVLRENFSTIQVVAQKGDKISKQMLKFISKIPMESIVDITALVTKPAQEVTGCSQKVELSLLKVFAVNRSQPQLPFQIDDAARKIDYDDMVEDVQVQEENKEDNKQVKVLMKTRLDNRIMDLRTPAKQAIFRVQSGVCQLFREFLLQREFVEIHTPKLIAGTSEGGANVFKLKYFGQEACLAQSPQLYKQMCIMSDLERVFEIGPVFRAENSFTHRHMCEFTGLDIEMTIKEHYFELLDLMGELFVFIFKGLETKYAKELAAINEQFPFEPFKCADPVLKLTFQEGVKMLHEAGIQQDPNDDLSTETEKKLGALVKQKYNTDFYMLHRYPKTARPFYTMLCKDDPNYTNSYDFFIRGEEIVSGAQRLHEPELLAKRAKECGINVDTIKDYIDSFKYGAFPHGGCGIGLERVVFLYCQLKNIRHSSLFPRDPKRITP